ncbi:MAG: YkvA family protein [Xenococcaceae cyanobacterium MO_188.B29]|nr:YkvA family protein [Xenococcaceae cyanobacterium MO_188.B29]
MKISATSIYSWYRSTIRNPKYRWWIILGTLAYLISPIDISPDFIPIAGALDDFVLVSLLVTEVSQLIMDRYKSSQQKDDFGEQGTSNNTVDVEAEPVSTTDS